MAYDVFISYSSKDKSTADAACAKLEAAGIRCWIAPRDIRPGLEYASGIIDGIDACRVMVLILSSNANASPQVHREIERAVSKGLTIVPLRIEDIAPTQAMEYYLGSIHWLDALTPPLANHLEQLTQTVSANLQLDTTAQRSPAASDLNEASVAPAGETDSSAPSSRAGSAEAGLNKHVAVPPMPRRAQLWGIVAIGIVALVIAVGWSVKHGGFFTSQTDKQASGSTVTPSTPVQQNPSVTPSTPARQNPACRDVLCGTDWIYSDSTTNPPRSLGFAQDQIAIVGGAKGTYSLDGNNVYLEVNDKYAEYHGTLNGNQMSGYASNVNKFSWTWAATKK